MGQATTADFPSRRDACPEIFSAAAGLFVALSVLKFGNPVIFENKIPTPRTFIEIVDLVWPIGWGYIAFALLAVLGLAAGRWKKETPKWILILPLIWLGWQFLAATQTVNLDLTTAVLKHFVACVACFFLGWFALSEAKDLRWFFVGVFVGFVWMLRIGLQQHFGGLEATRRYFYLYVPQNVLESSPEFLKKISSNRIFSTLFYPNSFAGLIVLLLPALVFALVQTTAALRLVTLRWMLIVVFGGSALACIYWSGSKSAWLVLLLLAAFWIVRSPIPTHWKKMFVALLLVAGLAGFFIKYAGFFERGATSVGARFDYWRAAVQIAAGHPVLGTGPGTFSVEFKTLKDPNSEMARLCHNDYLEQACDSGIIGFVAYTLFIFGSLGLLYRQSSNQIDLKLAIWLGLAGFAVHSFLEFHLYIPALAWTYFLLLGYLCGTKPIDKPVTPSYSERS
jgi:O-antigen ligase